MLSKSRNARGATCRERDGEETERTKRETKTQHAKHAECFFLEYGCVQKTFCKEMVRL